MADLHRIEDDIDAGGWAWIAHGIGLLEQYLAKHAAFLDYLNERE